MKAVKFAADIADTTVLVIKTKYRLTARGEKRPDELKVSICPSDVSPLYMSEGSKTLVLENESLYGFETVDGIFEKDIVRFKDKQGTEHVGEVIYDKENGLHCLRTPEGKKYPLYSAFEKTVLGSSLLGDKPWDFAKEVPVEPADTGADSTEENEYKGVYEIYTDGSCIGNPGACGAGFAVLDAKGVLIDGICVPIGYGTNNIAELTAINEALSYAMEKLTSGRLTVYSDSEYMIKGLTIWSENWRKNDWKKSSGDPVQNAELWQKLIRTYEKAKESFDIELTWVKGHDNNYWNEKADELAGKAAEEAARRIA